MIATRASGHRQAEIDPVIAALTEQFGEALVFIASHDLRNKHSGHR